MPNWVLVDKDHLDEAMWASADALRAKMGSTDLITWDKTRGFAQAIAAITDGGADVKTCTVRPYLTNGMYYGSTGVYHATVLQNGEIVTVDGDWNSQTVIRNVVCGSVFFLGANAKGGVRVEGGAVIRAMLSSSGAVFSMPTVTGADVQLFAAADVV